MCLDWPLLRPLPRKKVLAQTVIWKVVPEDSARDMGVGDRRSDLYVLGVPFGDIVFPAVNDLWNSPFTHGFMECSGRSGHHRWGCALH